MSMAKKRFNVTYYKVKDASMKVLGKMLDSVFMTLKREGLKIRVMSFDGQRHEYPVSRYDPTRVNVIVTSGIIRKSWVG